jgi:hypothetical protein
VTPPPTTSSDAKTPISVPQMMRLRLDGVSFPPVVNIPSASVEESADVRKKVVTRIGNSPPSNGPRGNALNNGNPETATPYVEIFANRSMRPELWSQIAAPPIV